MMGVKSLKINFIVEKKELGKLLVGYGVFCDFFFIFGYNFIK